LVTALTSNTLELLEKQLEKSISELQEELKKTVKSFGLNSTRTIGKSKQLDKFIFELQVLKQIKKSYRGTGTLSHFLIQHKKGCPIVDTLFLVGQRTCPSLFSLTIFKWRPIVDTLFLVGQGTCPYFTPTPENCGNHCP